MVKPIVSNKALGISAICVEVKNFNALKFYSSKVKIIFSFYLIEEAKHAVN